MKLHTLTFILLIVGGLNWLLVGLTSWDLFWYLNISMTSTIARVVYVLVGLSAIVEIINHKKNCRNCGSTGSSSGMGM